MPRQPNKNRTLLFCLLGLTWGIGITIAAVPLYRIFCQHFGIPTPQIITGSAPQAASLPADAALLAANQNRTVTVRFTANTAGGIPITFGPQIYTRKVRLGEPVLTAYDANNKGSRPIDGVAVHMLYAMGGSPDVEISQYVDLQQCFCFAQEHYPAHTAVNLPLSFTISPNLPAGIHTITFAYTLFEALPNDPRIKATKTGDALPPAKS